MSLHEETSALELAIERHTTHVARRVPSLTVRTEIPDRFRARAGLPHDVLTIGLIGGTGVGKSTLINALAGATVSAASDRRPTTERIVPYVHTDRITLLESLAPISANLAEPIHPHDIERLRSLVILDLPDMDSIEERHATIVRDAIAILDVLVVVSSLTKYHDRSVQEWLAKWLAGVNLSNCFFVLNKIDEVDPADGPDAHERLRQRFTDVVIRTLRNAGHESGKPRFYLISATRPRESLPGNAFAALERDLFAERDERERMRIKASNRIALVKWRLDRIEEASALNRRREWLASELAFIEDEAKKLGSSAEVRAAFEDTLVSSRAFEVLLKRCFDMETASWPLLGHLDFLLMPFRQIERVVRLLSRFVAAREDHEHAEGPLDRLRERIAQIQKERRRRRADEVSDIFENDPGLDGEEDTTRLLAELERGLEDDFHRAASASLPTDLPPKKHGLLRRLLVYGPLFWFPICQPLIQELTDPRHSASTLPIRLTHQLVRITGAMHLLTACLFVLAVWFFLLLLVRARARRRAKRQCHAMFSKGQLVESLDQRIAEILGRELARQAEVIDRDVESLESFRREHARLAARLAN